MLLGRGAESVVKVDHEKITLQCLREATIRRDVVVQLIRMYRDHGHPDYQGVDMKQVEMRAERMASTNDPTIPEGLLDALEESEEEKLDDFVDKAATPAERIWTEDLLVRDMQRIRPLNLVPQRDGDAQRDEEAARKTAFSQISMLAVKTGSRLEEQFKTLYIPRVFNLTLPWCTGGPDFKGVSRPRRFYGDAPMLSLNDFTSVMAQRIESQIRWDWDFNPGLWSLAFASKVNLSMSLSFRRSLRKSDTQEVVTDHDIGKASLKLLQLLEHGEYMDKAGRRIPVKGDISKLQYVEGLGPTEALILRNYHFIASRVGGTRQVRRRINHMVFSTRICYGCPAFVTVPWLRSTETRIESAKTTGYHPSPIYMMMYICTHLISRNNSHTHPPHLSAQHRTYHCQGKSEHRPDCRLGSLGAFKI